MAGRSVSDSLSGIISRGSKCGDTFRGRDMGPHVFDGLETRGGAHRVIEADGE